MNAIKLVVILLAVLFVLSCGGGDDVQRATNSSVQSTTTQSTVSRRMKLAAVTAGSGNSALDQTPTGFFYPIGKSVFSTGSGWWLSKDPDYFTGEYHIGVDMMRDYGKDVYAVADGKVVYISYDTPTDGDGKKWGVGNCGLVIEHKTSDGNAFTALYGHVQCVTIPAKNTEVYAGKPIGKIGEWAYGNHLHFGIHEGPFRTMASNRWGKMPISSWTIPCEGNSNCDNGMTDPIAFINDHYAYNPSTEVQTRCQGDICWEPKTASCETATSRYRLLSPPFARAEGSSVCSELQANLTYITSAPNPEERVPEDHGWRKWWRAIRNFFGETVSAADIRDFGTINTISVLMGNVVAGNATLSIHGAGQGYATAIADAAVVVPPDFVTKRTWLETPWGVETYRYGRNEVMKMKARFENIGDGPCDPANPHQTIPAHFYLSRGYKEDAHSDWKLVGTDEIQCSNLKPGDTHTETEGIELWRDIPENGIWNIVTCVDHPLTQNNNGGYHLEKHESNNCSTEAVFEVVDGTVNVPDVDIIPLGFTVLQMPYYAGDYARLGAYVKNQGTVNASADTVGYYTVSCNGGPTTVLTTDTTRATSLTAGAANWEETVAPVLMPNVVGTCTLSFVVDVQNAQPESDETNNVASITVTLAPRPAPNLVITKFQDSKGCCTTNRGNSLYPRIWVRNDGPVAPGANVTVTYEIANINAGGPYSPMGTGTIEPRELPPGGVDEDKMDCDGCYKVPSGAEWKNQWHYIRACLRSDGGAPTYAPYAHPAGEVCAVYWRYSKS